MEFGHTELFCDDVEATAAFYTDVLGFELVAKQTSDLIWVAFNGKEFLLRKGSPDYQPPTYQDSRSALVLYTNDLPTTKSNLEKKGLKFKGTDGSPKCLTFKDPSGHWWQLVNPNDH